MSEPLGIADKRVTLRELDLSGGRFLSRRHGWGGGIAREVRFWRNQLETGGGKWREEFQTKIGVAPPLDGRLESLAQQTGLDAVDILDVGVGPVTSVGRNSTHCRPLVRAVDPLAPLYSRLLAAAGVTPGVETEFAAAEALSYFLPLHSSDVVHCRNALDDAINLLVGILQMLAMLGPGGASIRATTPTRRSTLATPVCINSTFRLREAAS